jgi:SAM-dependent methyltransferase
LQREFQCLGIFRMPLTKVLNETGMIAFTRKVLRYLAERMARPSRANRIATVLGTSSLSPVDRHVALNLIYNQNNIFNYSYDDWRIKRINKTLEIYGIDWFKGKSILELGGGLGEIGAFFADLGANVISLDGRQQNVNFATLKHRRVVNFKCAKFDLDDDFSHFGRFDLIINFGVLYHLRNVDEHLKCCFKMSDEIILETVVCDSTDPHKIFYCDENSRMNSMALNGVGSRPSPFYIERIAAENGFRPVRHFSTDLNSGYQYSYDWRHKNNNRLGDQWKLRRFWLLKRES